MSTTYAKKNTSVQNVLNPSASSVLDSSSQSESLQRKASLTNNAAQRAEAPRPNNTGMPDNLKSGIESLSGFSMDDVRVHYNSSKPATVQALAYTQGTDIHVAPGQEKHLPHEAWHVAQQMAGRVSPTTNINGMPVNDNAGLEHEADVMGEKAVQCKTNMANNTVPRKEQCRLQNMETLVNDNATLVHKANEVERKEAQCKKLIIQKQTDFKTIQRETWNSCFNIKDAPPIISEPEKCKDPNYYHSVLKAEKLNLLYNDNNSARDDAKETALYYKSQDALNLASKEEVGQNQWKDKRVDGRVGDPTSGPETLDVFYTSNYEYWGYGFAEHLNDTNNKIMKYNGKTENIRFPVQHYHAIKQKLNPKFSTMDEKGFLIPTEFERAEGYEEIQFFYHYLVNPFKV